MDVSYDKKSDESRVRTDELGASKEAHLERDRVEILILFLEILEFLSIAQGASSKNVDSTEAISNFAVEDIP